MTTTPNTLKPLRACSLDEIESAVAAAVQSLTNMEVRANISQLKNNKESRTTGCQEKYTLTISLDVGAANAQSIETNIDALI